MTKNETARILAVIAAAYPRFQVDSKGLTLNVWYEMLEDLNYKLVQVAIKKLILESPYPPTVSDVRKQVVDIQTDPSDRIDASTAWGEVINAVRVYGHHSPEKALESLSPRTRRVVKAIGWQDICLTEQLGVVRGQFLKMYETYTAREKQEALMPGNIREVIKQIGEKQQMLEETAKDNIC